MEPSAVDSLQGIELVASIPLRSRKNVPRAIKPAVLPALSARLKAVHFKNGIYATSSRPHAGTSEAGPLLGVKSVAASQVSNIESWGTRLCFCRQLALKLFVEPGGKGLELFIAAEEVADHGAAGFGAALFEDCVAIARAGIASQRIGGVELAEKVESDHLVEGIGVVVRRVAGEVAEARVHAVPIDPHPGLEAVIEVPDNEVEIDGLGVLVVKVKRERCVVELGAHAVGAPERAGALQVSDDFDGKHGASLVMAREGLQDLLVAEEFLEHLRG